MSNRCTIEHLSTRVRSMDFPHTMTRRRTADRRRLPHRPGIDGLRALAVIAVVLYHADVSWTPGGFLGVDVFFAISGYLICSMLLDEWRRTGRLAVPRFWLGRVRRLVPALGALLVGVTLVVPLVAPDAAPRLRGDVPAALVYVSNWWQIVRGQSYFEWIGRPPVLLHLWSLAVEEQFYLVFPMVLAVALRFTRRREVLAAGAVVLAVASAVAMAALWHPGADSSRVWFGTDTRAMAILAGVAVAFLAPLGRLRADIAPRARLVVDGFGVAALVVLALLVVRVDEFGGALYHGWFAVAAIASSVLVVVLAHPAARLGQVLGREPLRWIGTRSYAIYLWHWPVIVLTRPTPDSGVAAWQLLAFRLVLTAFLAEVSWRLVEQPFRTGAAPRRWLSLRPRMRRRATVVATGVAAVLVYGLGASHLPAVTTAGVSGAAVLRGAPSAAPPSTAEDTVTTTSSVASEPVTPAPERTGSVLALGDSVMLMARDQLVAQSGGRVVVDAAVGRQVADALAALQRYRDEGYLQTVSAVIVHLGTNGPLTSDQFDRLALLVEGVPRVVVIDVRVPRRWEQQSNASIDAGVAAHAATMRIARWHDASAARGVLGPDGVHPTPSGAGVYARAVVAQLPAAP